jgi:cytidylate kinase
MIITISRQSATNGFFVAQLVAERLGYRIYDGELLDDIARRLQVDPHLLQHFDETVVSPVSSIIWEWRSSITSGTYLRHLRETINAVAREGDAILIGRGANFVLRGPDYLHVRLVAPLELRVAMYMAGECVSEQVARHWIHDQDEKRQDFIHKNYHHAIDDPVWYDLTINLDGLSLEAIADIIGQAATRRQDEQLTAETTLPKYKELLARHRPPCSPHIIERTNVHQ